MRLLFIDVGPAKLIIGSEDCSSKILQTFSNASFKFAISKEIMVSDTFYAD